MNAKTFLHFLLLIAWLVLPSACNRSETDPAHAFRSFVAKIQAQDLDGAWAMLSKDTQEQFTDLVKRRSAASQGAIPNDPKAVIFGNATLSRPIENVEVEQGTETRATLKVTSVGGTEQKVTMVREGNGWRVAIELPAGV